MQVKLATLKRPNSVTLHRFRSGIFLQKILVNKFYDISFTLAGLLVPFKDSEMAIESSVSYNFIEEHEQVISWGLILILKRLRSEMSTGRVLFAMGDVRFF